MWPSLVNIIPWFKYEAQNMSEPSFRQELQCIKEVKHLQYIIAMIVWFCQWRQDQGWWPSLPTCNFQVRALATVNIKMRVMSVISQIDMTLGGETGFMSLNNPPVLGQDGPKEPTSWTHSAQHAVHHEAPQTNRDFLHASYCTGV